MPARFRLLACEVLREEAELLLRELGTADRFDAEWFEMGLHEKPEHLKAELKTRVAACAGLGYEAILLLFGLCSNVTAGLEAPAGVRLVIPRVHDCVSLYLGSGKRYMAEHAAEAGTYWFSRGFLHRTDGRSPESSGLGVSGMLTDQDGKPASREEMYRRFVEEYGEENADYLMETLVDSWKKNYRRAVYLDWDGNADREADKRYVQDYAEQNNWRFETKPVDLRLVRALMGGPWPEDEFVTVLPGQRVIATNDNEVMRVARV